MTTKEKYEAVVKNDASCDGRFCYAVKSTGIYCRPSCRSRKPNLENILFFDTPQEARQAGFRPCKRCCPDLDVYRPVGLLAEQMRQVAEAGFPDKSRVFSQLGQMGVTPKRASEIFKERFGVSPGTYMDRLRVGEACRRLSDTDDAIIEIAFALGFESVGAFYSFFGGHTGKAPGEYRADARARRGASDAGGGAFVYPTALGEMTIAADDLAVTAVRLGRFAPPQSRENALTEQAARQLEQYLAGARKAFTVPLRPAGTPFQRAVWQALREIPYGETRSYQQIAEQTGNGRACRAVGMANNKNPILILIPCHRVVGKNGSLVGYAAGLPVKQRLLALETSALTPSCATP